MNVHCSGHALPRHSGAACDDAWTVRVGEGPSSARFSVDSHADVIAFLEALAAGAAPAVTAVSEPPEAVNGRARAAAG